MVIQRFAIPLAAGLLALSFAPAIAGTAPASQRVAPYVGAYAGTDGNTSQAAWDAAQRDLGGGKLSYRRSFDKTIPAVGKEAWRKTSASHNFYSVKPPNYDHKGFIEGKYDAQLRAVAKELPPGTKFTVYHEPEDNFSGATFHKVMKKTVGVVKGVRPDVQVWYIAMAYQWRTNSKGNVGTNAGWIDAAKLADGVGLDIYAPKSHFKKISEDGGFTRWWNKIAQPSSKPWGIIERGISPAKGAAARTEMLKSDWAFLKSRGAKAFLYWNANIGHEDWRLTGAAEQKAYRDIAAEGRVP